MSYIGQNSPNLSECVLGDPSALTIVQWASQDYSPKDVVVENCMAFDTKKNKYGCVQAIGFVNGKEGERATMLISGLRKSRRHFAELPDVIPVPCKGALKRKEADNTWVKIVDVCLKDRMVWLQVGRVKKKMLHQHRLILRQLLRQQRLLLRQLLHLLLRQLLHLLLCQLLHQHRLILRQLLRQLLHQQRLLLRQLLHLILRQLLNQHRLILLRQLRHHRQRRTLRLVRFST